MLKNFYRIIDHSLLTQQETGVSPVVESFRFILELVPSHPVYEGHFPGNPVVPGVCQVQIIIELVTRVIQKEVNLFRYDNIKFLSMIVPAQTPVLTVNLDIRQKEQDQWDVSAIISHDSLVFIKFKGGFRPAE
jgi:3-hydroxyacyl-[acyl-carrier-protein] dehydratase